MASPWDAVGTPVETPNSQASPWDAVGAPVSPPSSAGPDGRRVAGKGSIESVEPQSFIDRIRNAFSGAHRTEFPDAIEFSQAAMQGGVRPEDLERIGALDLSGIHRSAVTPDPRAQVDILRRNIPGLESREDRFGNVMLRAPTIGVNDWAYLNRPGMSQRDFDEFLTQTLATLPFLGVAGTPASTVARTAVRSGAALGAGEVAKDAMAVGAGSEQGIDPTRAAVTSAISAVTGPGVPTAIVTGARDAARAAVSPVTNYVRSAARPQAEAERRVAESFVSDAVGPAGRLTPEQGQHLAANRLQIADAHQGLDQIPGGQATLMDVGGERTRALARSAANTSPEARATLEGTINPRFNSQSERTAAFLDSLLPGPTAQQSREALQEMAATARAPFYERAFRDGGQGVTSPVIDRLMQQSPALRRAMEGAVDELQNRSAAGRLVTAARGPQGYTLEFWDQVKRSLQDDFRSLSRGGRNSEAGNVQGILNRLVTALDEAVPSYQNARGVAMGLFRANDALEAGANFVSSKVSNRAAEEALATMTINERDLFARGFVEQFIANVNRSGDRRNLMNQIAASPEARARLEIALGPRASRELEAFVRAERVLDLARGAVQGNSTTARQLVELGLAGAAGGAMTGFDPYNPVTWLVAVLTKQGARRMHARVDARVAQEVAEMLVSRDPAVMRRGLERISHGPMLQALRDFDRRASGPARGAAMAQTADAAQDDRRSPSQADNAMAGQPGSSQDNPVRVRSRSEVEGLPPGTYVIDESGRVYRRR